MQSISHTLRYSLKVYAVIIPHIKRLLQLDSIHSIHVVIPCKQFHPCMGSCCIIQSLIIHALKDFCTYTKTLVTVWNYRPLNVIFLKSDSHVHRQFCRFGLLCTGMQESIIWLAVSGRQANTHRVTGCQRYTYTGCQGKKKPTVWLAVSVTPTQDTVETPTVWLAIRGTPIQGARKKPTVWLALSVTPTPVSYTHLTLPTTASV